MNGTRVSFTDTHGTYRNDDGRKRAWANDYIFEVYGRKHGSTARVTALFGANPPLTGPPTELEFTDEDIAKGVLVPE